MESEKDDRLEGQKIAIVGMAGRFPGAGDLEAFWKNLKDGVESVTHFTEEELLSSGVDGESLRRPNYVKAKPLLDGVELFDASFFGFSPKDAACMDPQNRLFMECVWQAIESAGYDAGTYEGAISVYAGAQLSSYLLNNLYQNPEAMALGEAFQTMIFNNPGCLTTAVAYKLNLKGPCYTIHTFCSTSLVAVHMACQSLLNFECDMAVAGGVAITVPQRAGYWYYEGSIVSPDGHCRPFDAGANGTVFGNGLGAVALKRLEDALQDGDHIEAVIIGSATNNDGSLKVSYAAPSVAGQAEVIVEALANADVDVETISYVEAHGTGTVLGDPAEVAGLTQAFRTATQKNGFCALGSVKGNIGHLDTAAGIAGLIKTVLALKHCAVPANVHFTRPNPDIDFENTPFYVSDRLLEWKREGAPRRAGISSFGVGGTNAHVILEEAPKMEASAVSRPWQLLPVSARTRSALRAATTNLCNHLRRHPDVNLADAAYTLCAGRKAFNHRCYAVCRDVEEAAQVLGSQHPGGFENHEIQQRDPGIVFLFPDAGSPFVNLGRSLYEEETVFREEVDRCSVMLRAHLGRDLREVLYPQEGSVLLAEKDLSRQSFGQAALFTIEFALAKLWNSWGIQQEAMVGCGIGEYVAACLGEAWSLDDALMLVAERGKLMEGLPAGVTPSAQEETITARLAGGFKNVKQFPLKTPFVSGTTGTWITSEEAADPGYWASQLREPARLSKIENTVWENPNRVLLAVGPATAAFAPEGERAEGTEQSRVILSLPGEGADGGECSAVLHALGQLWLRGVSVDWRGYYARERRFRVELPTYPFERKRFWIERAAPLSSSGGGVEAGEAPQDDSELLDILLAGDVETRRQMLMGRLKEHIEETSGLGPAEIEESVTFLEMGLDSLFLTRWASLLNAKFNVEVSMTDLLDGVATLGRLRDFLERELAERYDGLLQEIDGLSDEEVEQVVGQGDDDE